MLTVTRNQWQVLQNEGLNRVVRKEWIRSKRARIVVTTDTSERKIEAVLAGLQTAIGAVGLDWHVERKIEIDENLTELVQPYSSNVLSYRTIMPYFFPAKTRFSPFPEDKTYKRANPNEVTVVVTGNNGFRVEEDHFKAISNSALGLICLPIPSIYDPNVDFIKALSAHEAGHLFGLQREHHDYLTASEARRIESRIPETGRKRPIHLYQVSGEESDKDCVMTRELWADQENISRVHFCDRFIESAKIKWANLEQIHGLHYLKD